MANQIDPTVGNNLHALVADQARTQQSNNESNRRSAPPAAATTAPSDRVQLTETATLLQNLEKQVAAMPVVDTQRVEAVRGQVEEGRFHVDPERVADKMINLERMINAGS